ncbi:MAG: hypothetical protein ACRDL7_10300, partial [Gaiellaceae bacterium]
MSYPLWKYYPSRTRPPSWVEPLVGVFTLVEDQLDSRQQHGITSDAALAVLYPGLVALDFEVEKGKKRADKIRRPVLFGEVGREDLAYEVDAFQPDSGVALEVEAGRGARGNAVYRDLIQTSLLVDARFLALAVMLDYRHNTAGRQISVRSYADTRNLLDAIYA